MGIQQWLVDSPYNKGHLGWKHFHNYYQSHVHYAQQASENFSIFIFCEGNPPMISGSPHKGPAMWSSEVFLSEPKQAVQQTV